MCWFHGDTRLVPGSRVAVAQAGGRHELLLFRWAAVWHVASVTRVLMFSCDTRDSGLYSLAAVNSSGEVWHSWRLDITGEPRDT